jgi:hypothetical protein
MELNTEMIAFIGILFVALVALWALVRSNVVIANLIPLPLVQDLIRASVNTALDAAEARAVLTETTVDDELVALIRTEVAKVLGEAQAAKSDQNAVG